jgi:hypothetical protein
MNSYVKKGYVEGKVPYFSRQKKIGCEMRDLCEDRLQLHSLLLTGAPKSVGEFI